MALLPTPGVPRVPRSNREHQMFALKCHAMLRRATSEAGVPGAKYQLEVVFDYVECHLVLKQGSKAEASRSNNDLTHAESYRLSRDAQSQQKYTPRPYARTLRIEMLPELKHETVKQDVTARTSSSQENNVVSISSNKGGEGSPPHPHLPLDLRPLRSIRRASRPPRAGVVGAIDSTTTVSFTLEGARAAGSHLGAQRMDVLSSSLRLIMMLLLPSNTPLKKPSNKPPQRPSPKKNLTTSQRSSNDPLTQPPKDLPTTSFSTPKDPPRNPNDLPAKPLNPPTTFQRPANEPPRPPHKPITTPNPPPNDHPKTSFNDLPTTIQRTSQRPPNDLPTTMTVF
ncbi:formin-like protein 16 [Penaeus monodon]|uniref:formin-like protein 16 n=1 Tax=Penaeus monodon TaxID=6687 RepID=UPI0018A73176|nr:formin-like protein 16 [Penaeus monodon]